MVHRALVVGLWLLPLATARAAETRLRSDLVPSVGASVNLLPRLALQSHVEGRFVMSGPRWAGPASLGLWVGPYLQIHPIVGVSAHYLFAEGVFPLEGAARREHTGQLALRLASVGERVLIGNTNAIDLRGLQLADGWAFHPRTRNEVRLTGVFFPWLKLSAISEILVSIRLPTADRLQLRTGLALHGEIRRATSEEADEARRRPPPALFWFLGVRAGFHPMAFAYRARLPEDAPFERHDRATTVDLIISPSLAGLF